ncbi:MAG: CheR family methyltransferase [Archangium sp.]|nr:CheR family methyltransferase [Archangium sp.]
MRATDFRAFCDLAYQQAGIRLGEEKQALVSARVGKRLRALNLQTETQYLEVLRTDDGGELIEFLDVISTNFTSFFREPAHFDALAADLGKRLAGGQQSFKLWCAAASSGEEPYTIALVLDELFAGQGVDWRVLCTDISTRVLGMAKRGQYRGQQLKSVRRDALARSFIKRSGEGDEAIYEAGAELKSHLTFSRLNLARPPFPMRGPFDAVLCRNVMIYFDAPIRQALVTEMERLVRPGGLVFVGHAETLSGLQTGLQVVSPSVYRKPGAPP